MLGPSLNVSAHAARGRGAPAPDQAGVVALRIDLTLSGARAANVDKEFGVDAPPAGVTVTSDMVTVSAAFAGGTLSGWDFAGRRLLVNAGASCRLVDCLLESPGWGATATELADIYGAAGFERCTFRGHPAHWQIAMAVRWRDGSTPLGRTARNRYLEFIADAYKPHPREFIELCYFGVPVHAPAGTVAYDSGTTYAAGGFALDGSGNIFLSLVDANLGNALPAAGEANASWRGLAPHSDGLTFDRAEAVTFRRSLIDNTGTPPETVPDSTPGLIAPNGINNAWRTVRNAGTSAVYGAVTIDRVAVYRDGGASFPLQSEDGGQPNFNGPISVTNCWLAARPAPTPSSLKAAEFWLYLLSLGVTEAGVIAEIDAREAAQALTAFDAERLRIKIRKATQFDRLDPDLLALAQAMGVAADQAALDAHFRSARGL